MNIINDYKQLRIIESLKFAEENKKLKEKNKKLKEKNAELKEELAILKDLYSGATPQRYVKYKQKLEKIKEICQKCNIYEFCISDCKFYDNCSGKAIDLILQIVEGAEDDD